MPQDAADLPAFLENYERVFGKIRAPEILGSAIVTLSACSLVSKMDQTRASSYRDMKALILREYKMTPLAYYNKYQTATKQSDETYVMFINRLKTLLGYYVASRHVSAFDDLISLLVADHVKPMLPPDCLNHVLTVENTSDHGWVKHDRLAEIVDAYLANHAPQMPRRSSDCAVVNNTYTNTTGLRKSFVSSAAKQSPAVKQERRCFHCDSRMHLFKRCPHRDTTVVKSASSRINDKQSSYNQSTPKLPNTASVSATITSTAVHDSSLLMNDAITHCDSNVDCSANASVTETLHVTDFPSVDEHEIVSTDIDLRSSSYYSNNSPFASDVSINLGISSLSYVDVCINGVNGVVRGLHDSGAQISVIHPRVLEGLNLPCEGTIKLKGLFGDAVDADLVSLLVKLPQSTSIPVIMAMSSKANNDLILTDPVVKSLFASGIRADVIECTSVTKDVSFGNDVDNDDDDENDENDAVDDNVIKTNTERKPDLQSEQYGCYSKPSTLELIQEQKDDETLSQCWLLAARQKGGYYVKNGLLFHVAKIAGQTCEQLCVPFTRRSQVLSLAHEIYGAHFGKEKTRDRIRLSFYWPTLVDLIASVTV